MPDFSVAYIRKGLDAKEFSVAEVADQYTKRIAATNPQLNSFITVVDGDHVAAHTAHAQAEIDAGNQGPLTGVPYAAKDIFCTRGVRTTGASKILDNYIPPYSATTIDKCRDAVLLGKTNLDEFAMGSSSEYSAYGVTKNPFDLHRVAGGSSGGSAAAVAAGQAPFAFGTDTGGSIRLPAAFCNVVGFKPTYGRISRYGVMPMASSLDTVGTFTRDVADAALLLEQFAGHDPLDSTTSTAAIESYSAALTGDIKGVRVGIPKEYAAVDGMDPVIAKAYSDTRAKLQSLGAEVVDISLPHTEYAMATYYILCPSEVSSNMGKYDGMQYGTRAAGKSLEEVFLNSREQGIGAEVKRRIMIGTFCLSSGYYDAYYKKAQQARTLIKQDFTHAFANVDVIFTPVTPVLPFLIGARTQDPIQMYLADLFTIPMNLAGVPALSLPVGSANGLPIGMQVIANQFKESTLLRVAHALEQALRLPALPLDKTLDTAK